MSSNDIQNYYDKYINHITDLTCPICKTKKRKFERFSKGYLKTCGIYYAEKK